MTENTKTNKKRRRGRKGDDGGVPAGENISNYQAHKTPLVQLDDEAPTWHEYGKNLPGRNDTTEIDPPERTDQPNRTFVTKYRAIGDMIFQKEMQLVGRGGTSDERWVESTMKKGTLKDRIAAMSVTVSSDPFHKFYALDGLLSMVGCSESGGKTNSRVAQLTAEALEDLFLNTFLPADRKLLSLSQRPLYRYETDRNGKKSKKSLSPRILLLWRFEEMVKEKYDLYLRKYMGQTLQDGAEMQKIATLKSAGTLLSTAPEGESLLLSIMVNKLGDPAKKTASAAGHQLRMVLQQHPNMQLVVAREVQQLAHRPQLSPKALYGCIIFLNQLKLSKEDDPQTDDVLRRESLPVSLIKTYFRLFEVAVKKSKKESNPESEESGMKSRLLSALLTGVNRAHPYLPEKDKDMEEHIDALYRVVHTAAPAACTQALMLLFNLSVGSQVEDGDKLIETKDAATPTQSENSRKDRFYCALYATLSKASLVSYGKHLTMYFNLLYKAMKYDTDVNRVNAFAKRLMCTVLHSNPAAVAGSVFLLNEIAKSHDGLRICMEDEPTESDAHVFLDETKRDPRSALIMQKEDGSHETLQKVLHPPSWELSLVVHHFHPSVAKFAGDIGAIEYAGDPLKDFGLAPFLDKFAYRNPKSRDKLAGHFKRGQSVAERRSGRDGMMQARLELPVNDPAFLERKDVNEQDEFFHKFFSERARRDEIKGISRGTNQEIDEGDLEEAEGGALDAAEEADGLDTGKNFEEYERTWDTDSEEEAFVDTLAQKLMEDAAEGPVDYDDEDPEMDDWGDMYSDNDEENGKKAEAAVAQFEGDEIDDAGNSDEVPDLEESDADSDADDDESNEGGEAVLDGDAFMDASDSSDDNKDDADGGGVSHDEDDTRVGLRDSQGDDDDDEGDDLAFVEDEDSDDDDDDEGSSPSQKKAKTSSTFADADDYLEMISKSYGELMETAPKFKEEKKKVQRKTPKKVKKKRSIV